MIDVQIFLKLFFQISLCLRSKTPFSICFNLLASINIHIWCLIFRVQRNHSLLVDANTHRSAFFERQGKSRHCFPPERRSTGTLWRAYWSRIVSITIRPNLLVGYLSMRDHSCDSLVQYDPHNVGHIMASNMSPVLAQRLFLFILFSYTSHFDTSRVRSASLLLATSSEVI